MNRLPASSRMPLQTVAENCAELRYLMLFLTLVYVEAVFQGDYSVSIRTVARRALENSAAQLGRDDWIKAARDVLIAAGVDAVKINTLAAQLDVTRGSFYWHFKSRDDLLDALIESWRAGAVAPFRDAVMREDASPSLAFLAFCEVWFDAQLFNPALESATRDWARTSDAVDALVRKVDRERMTLLKTVLAQAGYDELEAEIRARITYYHQVGYYSLKIAEPVALRRKLLPTYFRVLAGFPVPAAPRS